MYPAEKWKNVLRCFDCGEKPLSPPGDPRFEILIRMLKNFQRIDPHTQILQRVDRHVTQITACFTLPRHIECPF